MAITACFKNEIPHVLRCTAATHRTAQAEVSNAGSACLGIKCKVAGGSYCTKYVPSARIVT